MGPQTLYGQQSTFSATEANLHINIEDMITKYPDWQFPLLKRWDSSNFKSTVASHKYEWSERDMRPVKTTVATGPTVATSATTFYVADSGVFNVDDVLRVQSSGELMIVTAVAGGTLVTVQREWGGTTAATINLGDTVYRSGVATPQGKDADDMIITTPSDLYNYTQILEDVVHLSGTQRESMIRGDQTSTQLISDKQKELMEQLQVTLLLGVRNKDTADKRTTMGGLKFFIDTYAPENVINFGGATTWNTDLNVLNKFEDAVQIIADKMGSNPTIYMGYKAMRKFRLLDDDLVRTTRNDKQRGIGVVDSYLSQLGQLDIVMLRERTGAMDDLIFFVDESKVGYKAMRNRGWFTEELAKTGDSYKWQVLGEYTAKVDTPKVLSYIYNLGL